MENPNTPKLGNQICFPLYVIAKEITGMYRPFLDELDLTYSQYLVMMVLWENDGLTVNQIGEKLYLDSGTLTPLLKRLEVKSLLQRNRKKEDERVVEVSLTEQGKNVRMKGCASAWKMVEKLNISGDDFAELKTTGDKILNKIEK